MRTSQFFSDLRTSYAAEIEDHSTDSEGKDILKAQLKNKRSQFADLLPMMGFAPEMVAIAFHGGINFPYPKIFETLLRANEPDEFPTWGEVAQSLDFLPWAQTLADRALEQEGGEQFMMITAALEFLQTKASFAQPTASDKNEDAQQDGQNEDHRSDDEREEDRDDDAMEEAGAAWMAEQGFDRLD